MKKSNLILALSVVCFSGIAAADIVANDSQSTANALNLQGQTSANYNAQLQGQDASNSQGQSANNSQGQSQTAGNNGQGQDQGQSVSFAGAGTGSGIANDNSTYNNFSKGSDLSKAVGIATAPSLTTTLTETCMGSTSMGGGFSGGSFSFGTTWRDHACVRRLDAREIKSFGDIQAAKEIMCDSDLVREAFKRVGRPCAEDGGTYAVVAKPEVAAPIAVVAPAPMAVTEEVTDDQDMIAKNKAQVLQRADSARQEMKLKYGW